MSNLAADRLPRVTRSEWIVLGVLLVGAALLRVNHLGHFGIKDLDEVFHALVARGLIDHPLTPTLYATPYLPFDPSHWQANHVWLHKPPVALWQMAASLGAFGESTFAMRLPSLLLSTAAVALTFGIAAMLGDARAGLVAAALQAVNPFVTRLVHGQVFSDHVDVALLFWTEAAVLLLLVAARSKQTSHATLAGVAQGLAWLTKSHPALFVAGLAALLAVVPRRDEPLRLARRQVVAFFVAAAATALPWTLWCLTRFPREFAIEQNGILRHLYADVEQFAAPWDRMLFDYTLRGLLEFWPLAAFALVALSLDAIRMRSLARGTIVAWALIVLIPHALATSKTPSATLIGWPAAWLAIGVVVSDATRGRRSAIAAVGVAALLIAAWPQRPRESVMGYGPDYHFAKIMLDAWPLLVQLALIALAAFLGRTGIPACLRPSVSAGENVPTNRARTRRTIAFVASAIAALIAITRHATLAYRTSADVDASPVAFPTLGARVRAQSPPEAVFLVDDVARNEHLIAMWWLDRACYPLRPDAFASDVGEIVKRGGTPFVLSRRPWPGTPLLSVADEGTIYRLDK